MVIVDTVGRHGGFVNKFQGDAALAIFGAPIEHPDASGAALAASRELHDELIDVMGSDMEFGIGVSAGRAIAGRRSPASAAGRGRRPGGRCVPEVSLVCLGDAGAVPGGEEIQQKAMRILSGEEYRGFGRLRPAGRRYGNG